MADERKFKTFKEFWPEYLRLHSKPITRAVHYAGTLGGIALAATGAIVGAPLMIVAAPVFTYGLLFSSHPIFEKNRPATFKNPFMSVGGDLKLLFCFLTGRIRDEYKKHGLDYTGKTGNNQNDPGKPVAAPAAQKKTPNPVAGLKSRLTKVFGAKTKPQAAKPAPAPAPAPKAPAPKPA
jgi:hypothetical protein